MRSSGVKNRRNHRTVGTQFPSWPTQQHSTQIINARSSQTRLEAPNQRQCRRHKVRRRPLSRPHSPNTQSDRERHKLPRALKVSTLDITHENRHCGKITIHNVNDRKRCRNINAEKYQNIIENAASIDKQRNFKIYIHSEQYGTARPSSTHSIQTAH